jgi:flavin-dependent thymidylate synthase
MRVILAGYNVDAEVLAELSQKQNRQDVTPETISAAYARISRDPRPVTELRKIARQEVEKARKSNATIVFKMGHHSVAEHAVFNFDILDVSRLALEEIEKFRLCSYTEKSQRYQKLEDNYVLPAEIRGSKQEGVFIETIEAQNGYYQQLIERGIDPEDARYVTGLAVCGQVGMTMNARNLELLIRRFASSSLAEVRQLGEQIYEETVKIAPSLILFTAANDYDRKTYPELKEAVKGKWERKNQRTQTCELVDFTENADSKLAAALFHSAAGVSFRNCLRTIKDMTKKERKQLIKKAFQHMEFYDAALREFEHINLTYDLVLSSACFAQLKRHRLATITQQNYRPALGITIPPKIKAAGEEDNFMQLIRQSEKVYAVINRDNPLVAQYILTGAHRKRILMSVNARELYHISRLREDKHAQWDIQALSRQMTQGAAKVMPNAMLLIGGKDDFPDKFESVFGKKPRLLPPKE